MSWITEWSLQRDGQNLPLTQTPAHYKAGKHLATISFLPGIHSTDGFNDGDYKEKLAKVQVAKDIGKYICSADINSHSLSVFDRSIVEESRPRPPDAQVLACQIWEKAMVRNVADEDKCLMIFNPDRSWHQYRCRRLTTLDIGHLSGMTLPSLLAWYVAERSAYISSRCMILPSIPWSNSVMEWQVQYEFLRA